MLVDETCRWEWRAFAPSPARFGALAVPDGDAEVSREQYVLSSVSPHNVKVRNDRLEIKELVAIHPAGLEQWRPTLKAAFPIDAAALAAARRAWGVGALAVAGASFTVDEFLRLVAASEPTLRVVAVEKSRTRLIERGCPGEHVRLTIAGAPWESIAFEHADPLLVQATVRALGLGALPNRSYPAALKTIVGFGRDALSAAAVPSIDKETR